MDNMQQENQAEGDSHLYVQFYMGSRENKTRSVEEGHPVFDAMPFVRIIVPGDKNTVIDTVVDASHKRRFAKLWQQFEANETQDSLQGMPLKEWPAITRAQADELTYLNIRTVEQLAGCADVYGGKIMGFHALKRKAETYLQASKDTSLAMKLSEENAALKQQLDLQKVDMAEMSRKLEILMNERGTENKGKTFG